MSRCLLYRPLAHNTEKGDTILVYMVIPHPFSVASALGKTWMTVRARRSHRTPSRTTPILSAIATPLCGAAQDEHRVSLVIRVATGTPVALTI